MSNLVNPDEIEKIVGVKRQATEHMGMADSSTGTVYILHPVECKESGVDLRECEYSVALDRGITSGIPASQWQYVLDQPVVLEVVDDWLLPQWDAVVRGLMAKNMWWNE